MKHTLVEIWRDNPIRVFSVAVACMACSSVATLVATSYVSSGAAVTITRPVNYHIEVNGTNLDVVSRANRTAHSCQGARSIRRMVKYSDAEHQHISDYVFVQETDPPIQKIGEEVYTMHFTLRRPLWGQGWYFTTELQDNCGLLGRLFGSRSVMPPPVPVVVENK